VSPRLPPAELAAQLGDWSSRPHGSLSRRLAAALRSRIVAGLLPAGVGLPPERQLAQALAVSRSTLVVALDELRAEGLVHSRVGSGTTVGPLTGVPIGAPMGPAIGPDGTDGVPSPRRGRAGASLADRVLGHRGGINLGVSAPPDAQHLPDLQLSTADLVAVRPSHGYEPAGLAVLREQIAERQRRAGLPAGPDRVHVTCGAQHAIDLALAALTRPGDRVVVEDPTYPGALDALRRRQLVPIGVPALPGAELAEHLARACREARPALVYLMASVHNPTGRVLGEEERVAVARAVDRPGSTVLEDDTLADLAFDGRRPPSLAAYCRRADVVSVGSLSKVAWGGLRVGWLQGPAAIVAHTVRARHEHDLGTSVPSQLLALQLLRQLDEVIARRRAMLLLGSATLRHELCRQLPGFEPGEPRGGLSAWVRLPAQPTTRDGDSNDDGDNNDGVRNEDGDVGGRNGGGAQPDSGILAQRAARHGVGIAAGGAASLSQGPAHLRLCFDRPPEELHEGVARLAAAWAELTRRPPPIIG
jgi:DNA-binding transcriptional MocR family regulator